MELSRRRFLGAGSVAAVGSMAGCLGSGLFGGSEPLPAPSLGDADAPVVVESFEDFTCKFCALFSRTILPDIVSTYVDPGTVRFVRHDYPFLDPDWSFKAANAARAVQKAQGDEAFFAYAERLYENYDSYSLDLIGTLAEPLEVDPETVRTAASEGTYRETLEAEIELGDEKGVEGTPTVFVNGEQPESPRYRHVAAAIESQL